MDFRELKEFIKDFLGYIISFLFLFFILAFVVSFQPVAGNSMYPTLKEGDFVIVSKFFYNIGDPKRNEIVNVKDDLGKSYVKRIIGLPGEKIEYLDNILYINDKPFLENFTFEEYMTSNFLFEDICSKEDCPEEIIPKDMYLLLGDNRGESVDSRTLSFGLRNKKDINGRIIYRIWPANEFGQIE
ncbi:MAG: signal peptidase I [Bacilli bacterium]|nr:signal peptidase I [Bacilli bacterium]